VRVAAGFDDATRSELIVESVLGVCSEGATERPEIGRNEVAILGGFTAALEGRHPTGDRATGRTAAGPHDITGSGFRVTEPLF
jgi:hypothetical protein